MWKKLSKYIFPSIIALSALSVSASAAFYSVSGLSKLFAGAAFAVIIMAGSLEVAKLVIASLLHQYWTELNKALRIYLTLAAGILILITSAGIYGFLSAAYQETANKAGLVDSQVKLLETKKAAFEKAKGQYDIEKEALTQNITTLRNALGNNTQSYVDASGNTISYSSSANRKAFEKQLEVAIQKDEQLTTKIQTYNDSIINLETRIVETQSNSEVAAELGPLKYLSNLTGKPMDQIINWFLLVIIFVFDPLAIALVVTANFAFARVKKENDVSHIENQVEPEKSSTEHQDLEEASLEDLLEEEWDEDHALDMVLNDMVEDLEEPYQVYVSGSQPIDDNTLTDAELLAKYDADGDGTLTAEELKDSNLSQERINKLTQRIAEIKEDTNLSSWRKNKWIQELDRERASEERRKQQGGDDLTIKYN